jgi:hypothetical protein
MQLRRDGCGNETTTQRRRDNNVDEVATTT